RAGLIVIFHVTEQQVTEVALAEYNNVVKVFPSDRTDQPFRISILPRAARRYWSIADAHRSESTDKNLTIGAVPVTNEIAGSLFPPACFRDLICDPFCGWMRCDAKPQNMSPAVPHDQQSIEQAKRDCRHDKQIHRRDAVCMIADKGSPALRRRVSSPDHVFGDAGLADLNAELKQLALDPRRPHSGLATLISRISRRISTATVGRPERGRDFQRQYDLNPARCQRTTVSGFTIVSALTVLGAKRYSPTKIDVVTPR